MSDQEFNQKVMVYSSKLFNYSYKLLGNKEDAHDVVQDSFFKLWTIRDKLGGLNSIEAFAITITRNLCIDKIKRSKGRILGSTDLSKIQLVDDQSINGEAEAVESKMRMVKIALGKLTELQQKVFIMRDLEEKEFEEIAMELNITVDNTRVILSRARQKIREIIQKKNG